MVYVVNVLKRGSNNKGVIGFGGWLALKLQGFDNIIWRNEKKPLVSANMQGDDDSPFPFFIIEILPNIEDDL